MRRGKNQNDWGEKKAGDGWRKERKNKSEREDVGRQMESKRQREQLNQSVHPSIS